MKFRSNRGGPGTTLGHYESERGIHKPNFSRLENNFPAYHSVMTQRLSTQRQNTSRFDAGKFPAILAMIVLCVWPAWAQPCQCSATAAASFVQNNAQPLAPAAAPTSSTASSPKCEQCCQTDAAETAHRLADSEAGVCSCCDSDECSCDVRVRGVQRLRSTVVSVETQLDTPLASLDFLGSLSLAAQTPQRFSSSFLLRDDSGVALTAPDRLAVLCVWLI